MVAVFWALINDFKKEQETIITTNISQWFKTKHEEDKHVCHWLGDRSHSISIADSENCKQLKKKWKRFWKISSFTDDNGQMEMGKSSKEKAGKVYFSWSYCYGK